MKNQSSKRGVFFTLSAAVLLANLLVMNDVATLWDGAEARFVWQSLFEPGAAYFPHGATALFSGGTVRAFWLRLPGVLLGLLAAAGVYAILHPVLGRRATRWWLLTLGASLLIPQLAKVAAGDIWSFVFQWAAAAALVRFLKQPLLQWRILFYLLLLPAIWADPVSSTLFFTLFPALLNWRHPQGRRLRSLQPWLAAILAALLLWSAGAWMNWQRAGFYFTWAPGRYLLFNFLAFLPFLGFAIAGIADAVGKMRRGEELSLLFICWVVSALLVQSLLLQAGLAFLVGKQLHLYFQANYPYRSWVRAGAVIHLILVFFLIMGLMLYGFGQFGGLGFRAAMGFGAVYWMAGFIAVIGLFGMNRRFVWGGTVFGTLAAVLLFWLQLYPLIESRRDVPKRLAAAAAGAECRLAASSGTPGNEALYLRAACEQLLVVPVDELPEDTGESVWILPVDTMSAGAALEEAEVIKGWDDKGREVSWWVVRK